MHIYHRSDLQRILSPTPAQRLRTWVDAEIAALRAQAGASPKYARQSREDGMQYIVPVPATKRC